MSALDDAIAANYENLGKVKMMRAVTRFALAAGLTRAQREGLTIAMNEIMDEERTTEDMKSVERTVGLLQKLASKD